MDISRYVREEVEKEKKCGMEESAVGHREMTVVIINGVVEEKRVAIMGIIRVVEEEDSLLVVVCGDGGCRGGDGGICPAKGKRSRL